MKRDKIEICILPQLIVGLSYSINNHAICLDLLIFHIEISLWKTEGIGFYFFEE